MDRRTRIILIALAVAGVLLAVVMFMAGRSCAGSAPAPLNPGGIDAGPGEDQIAQRLDGSIQHDQAQLEAIDQKYRDDIAALDDVQRREYERLRAEDVDALARQLNDWNQERTRPDHGEP